VLGLVFAASRIYSMTFVLRLARGVRRIPQNERETSLATSWFFITGDGISAAVLLINTLAWSAAWPYLAAIVWS
jgi:hypothetical protein